MSDQPPYPEPPAPPGPPTDVQYPVAEPSKSSWPVALGIILVVWALLGLCSNTLTLVFVPLMQQFSEMEGLDLGAGTVISEKWMVPTMAMGVIFLALAILLIVGGIQLLRRQPGSVPLIRWWAILTLVGMCVQSVLAALQAPEQIKAMEDNPGMQNAAPAVMEASAYFGVACSLLLFIILPIFLLIWFNRAPIKDEVESWRTADAQPHDLMPPPGA